MPVKKAAIKDIKQADKREKINIQAKKKIKDLTKAAARQIEAKEKEAVKKVHEAYKAIDRAAQKGIIKKNAAGRKKSRLMKKFNKMGK
ncbi:30S ribosomal protein S20 [Patescibacteria group bacterium]|nr:30S ribosomal protein S20 [Patescibacteria group bacterium]MBU1673808.1 30S ribosomal protein S20 [Patescibacteria group bacterium]MBU1963770.1 30S ribosomal protein S20 [Patescibacteria group bacterium]